ncbi:hypothetical protein ZYGM_004954 [Zygosaccharomyces mellis]|uniref:N-acetyltransferase SLI1 n=1 Tax=Zygosaccharomyces mellis TaxID=42258 RepID=A0A4C2E5Z9_9SACH|nr:hypothetical protein ZYGM_004954 [Zygosaccharomyces mellis]
MRIKNRKLSSLERYFYTRSILNLHSCFYVGIRLNQLPSKAELRSAIKRAIDKFIQLRCNVGIDEKDGKPYFKIVDQSLGLEDVVEFVDWTRFDEDKMNYVFQNYAFRYHTEKPLWKMLVIPSERKLVLLMSHVLFDGMAGVIIWQELLKNLNEPKGITESRSERIYEPNESQGFTSDYHPYEGWPITLKTKVLRFLFGQYLKWKPINADMVGLNEKDFKFKNYSLSHLIAKNPAPTGDRYQVRCDSVQWNIHLTLKEMQNVLRLCREHKVSLSSLLTALFAQSLIKFSNPANYTGCQLKICLPMNTRIACNKYLQNDDYTKQLGNFVGTVNLSSNINDKISLWELSKLFQKDITQKVGSDIQDFIDECSFLDVLNIEELFAAKVAASNPSDTFEVSNLGFQSFNNSEDSFEVIDAFFNQPQGISSNFCCSVISTNNGLNCHVTIPRNLKEDLVPCIRYVENWLRWEGKE